MPVHRTISARCTCVPAWKIDPLVGVIGVQN
jgi:hypothetical protein